MSELDFKGLKSPSSVPNLSDLSIDTQLIKTWELIKADDKVIQTVRLESGKHRDRERYLAIILVQGQKKIPSKSQRNYVILGIDRCPNISQSSLAQVNQSNECTKQTMSSSIGLVLGLDWYVKVSLDGDGGFSLRQSERNSRLIFKPVSIQSLWSVIQTLHLICDNLRPRLGSGVEPEVNDLKEVLAKRYPVTSSQSCINEWNFMADILVRRPSSMDRIGSHLDSGISTEEVIRNKLREIMKSVDLDTVTSKGIRIQLENDLKRDLENYKSFIDKEMLIILGQMDPASKILDHLYLGSEWNASNLEELQQNGITHILNVTREIDNFFPALFSYLNIREYDEEATDLFKYLNQTYKFIRNACKKGGKILVHCKMGISRSATVTIAYIMKEYDMNLKKALSLVKGRRSIVKPNSSFLKQLEVYEGILEASRYKDTRFSSLYRSKSESSLETPAPSCSMFDRSSIRVDIKKLSIIFDQNQKRPHSEPNSLDTDERPSKSWMAPEKLSKLLFTGCKNKDKKNPHNCQCYSKEITRRFSVDHHMRLSKESHVEESLINATKIPVNSSTFYDSSCQCDMEIELKVPDESIMIEDFHLNQESDKVVQEISDISLRLNAQNELSYFNKNNKCIGDTNSEEDEEDKLSEELSVKTIAKLFDHNKTTTSN